jgi:hypothetical protein
MRIERIYADLIQLNGAKKESVLICLIGVIRGQISQAANSNRKADDYNSSRNFYSWVNYYFKSLASKIHLLHQKIKLL